MEQVHRHTDNLLTDVDHLDRILDSDETQLAQLELALAVAKRVRRASTLLIRALASERDNRYSPQEAQANGTKDNR